MKISVLRRREIYEEKIFPNEKAFKEWQEDHKESLDSWEEIDGEEFKPEYFIDNYDTGLTDPYYMAIKCTAGHCINGDTEKAAIPWDDIVTMTDTDWCYFASDIIPRD